MCLVAGRAAMERYQQRQPHAVMSWSRMVRLFQIGFDFGNLACGLDSPNRLPEKIPYDYELTNLKRSYAVKPETPPIPGGASVLASRSENMVNPPSIPAGGIGGSPQGLPASQGGPPQGARSDAWSRWARTMRRMRS